MELSGEVELDGVSTDDAWAVFSDPVAIRDAIPGCKRLTLARDAGDSDASAPDVGDASPADAVRGDGATRTFQEDDEYTAVIQAGTRSIKPKFESAIRITVREFPRMSAHVEGAGGESAFDMVTRVEFVETGEGVSIAWESDFDVAGRLGQVDASILSLVSEKMVDHFFDQIERHVAKAPA